MTPLVEPLSLDEAYLDVTENAWGEPLGVEVARRLKARIREETRLTASAGVAPNKFLAKIASGWKKPDGLTVIAPERVERFLQELPVDALWGVGPVTAGKLRAAGHPRLVDVRTAPDEVLQKAVGSWAERAAPALLRRGRARGQAQPGAQVDRLRGNLREGPRGLARDPRRGRGARRAARPPILGRKELFARTVVLKLRYANFPTITRSHTPGPADARPPTRSPRAPLALLEKTDAGRTPVRLLGVSVHGLARDRGDERRREPSTQLDLPSSDLSLDNSSAASRSASRSSAFSTAGLRRIRTCASLRMTRSYFPV